MFHGTRRQGSSAPDEDCHRKKVKRRWKLIRIAMQAAVASGAATATGLATTAIAHHLLGW